MIAGQSIADHGGGDHRTHAGEQRIERRVEQRRAEVILQDKGQEIVQGGVPRTRDTMESYKSDWDMRADESLARKGNSTT